MQTEDAGVKSSHPHFKFKKGNDMNDTMTKGNAAALLPIGVFLLIFLGAGIAFETLCHAGCGCISDCFICGFYAEQTTEVCR